MDVGRRGPEYCHFVLVGFLTSNATRRLVTVVPVEFPIEPSDRVLRKQGTQELIVTTADTGPWPLAGDLEVSPIPCLELREGQPAIPEAQACLRTIRESGNTSENTPIVWIPLTGEGLELDPTKEDTRPRTVELLKVSRRRH